MRKFLSAVLVFACLFFSGPAPASQDVGEIADVVKKTAITFLEIELSVVLLNSNEMKSREEMTAFSVKQMKVFRTISQFLKKGKEEKNDALILLSHIERMQDAVAPFTSKAYNQEIFPLIVGHLKGRPLPQKPTKIQEGLVKALSDKEGFDSMIRGVERHLAQEMELLQQGQIELAKRAEKLKEQIEKLKKK